MTSGAHKLGAVLLPHWGCCVFPGFALLGFQRINSLTEGFDLCAGLVLLPDCMLTVLPGGGHY